jgi:DNA-binding response OmpR family regulator
MNIWVVDDDSTMRQLVAQIVSRMEGELREFDSADGVLEAVAENPPDLIVLDVMLPGKRGTDLCVEIRGQSEVPIIFISTEGEAIDRVIGLELGADDYIAKPFHPRELEARIKAVLRRGERLAGSTDDTVVVGVLELDELAFKVSVRGMELELTRIEFMLLKTLMEQPRRVFSRDALMRGAYDGVRVSRKTIDSHIRRLRSNFTEHDIDPVRTVRGVGYALNLDDLED